MCSLIQTMRLMVELYARQLFFRFFLLKKERLARAKNDVGFYLIYFAVAQLLLRPDAIPYSPIFIYTRFNILSC